MKQSPQILFISHGGGPLPVLGDPGHADMVACLENLASTVRKPSAIVVLSAHWEERAPTITAAANPNLIYDYYNFPEESYQIQYPCPGEPELAQQLHATLQNGGFEPELNPTRGYDHGVFIPLKLMFPEADIPCVQVSLLNHLDPAEHIKLGEALANLAYDNLLVIGSGFSFHNLKAFFSSPTSSDQDLNDAFEAWLQEVCSNQNMNHDERVRQLTDWAQAPGARFCHPREEHLLPLHVCAGMAGRACDDAFTVNVLGKKSSMFLWR